MRYRPALPLSALLLLIGPAPALAQNTGLGLFQLQEGSLALRATLPEGEWAGGWRYGRDNRVAGAGNFDADTRDELLVTSDWGAGLLRPTLQGFDGVVAQEAGHLAGGWNLAPRDQHIVAVADLDGDGRDDMLVRSEWGLGVLGLASSGLATLAITPNGWIGPWNLDTTSQSLVEVANLDQDARHEVVVTSPWGIGVIEATGSSFVTALAEPSGTWFDAWHFDPRSTRVRNAADLNGDSREELVVTSDWGLGVLRVVGERFTSVAAVQNGTRLDGWVIDTQQDEIATGADVDGNGSEDLVVTSPWGIGFLTLRDGGLRGVALFPNGTWFGVWNYASDSTEILGAGDFDGDRAEELVVRSDWGLGILELRGGEPASLVAAEFGSDLGGWELAPSDRLVGIVRAVGGGPAMLVLSRAPDDRLDLVQYNVQFLTPELQNVAIPGHRPNTEERARAIGQMLACSDLVTLNETLNKARGREIVDAMERAAGDCAKASRLPNGRFFDHVAGPKHGVRFDDEVMIVSRLPILSIGEHVYTAASGIDRGAAKGVLHARLSRGEGPAGGDRLDLFTTHLQNADADARSEQLEELAAFLHERLDPGVPAILTGDFNIEGVPPSEGNDEYRRMIDLLAPLGFLDAGTDVGGTNESGSRRIDYVFVRGAIEFVSPAAEGPDSRFGTLSDHRAVTGVVIWPQSEPRDPPLEAAQRLVVAVERLQALSEDSCEDMEFRGSIELASGTDMLRESFGISEREGDDVAPGWRLSIDLPPFAPPVIATVGVREDDDAFCGGGDDPVDINPRVGARSVRLQIEPGTGLVRLQEPNGLPGAVVGRIGTPLVLAGTEENETGRATILVSTHGD